MASLAPFVCLAVGPLRRTLVSRTRISTSNSINKQSGTDGLGTRSVRHQTPTNVPADGLVLEPEPVDRMQALVLVVLGWVPGGSVPRVQVLVL